MSNKSSEYKKIHKQLFPVVKSFTTEESEAIWKEFQNLPSDRRRIVFAMMVGTFTARVNSPSKTYQVAARHFFNEMKTSIDDSKKYE